ncbi:MAG: hypothetical protein LJE96_12905 [Deltaproteobacteria bacterium]|nr:hypothetical protein [Deltaproteobacteria bacterium]
MAALLVCAPGYGSAQQPKDTSAGTAKSFTPEERKAYEEKIAAELEAIQGKIADLRIQASTGPSQNKRMISLAANDVQMQKIAADNELTALEKSSEANWVQQKAKLDKIMEKLRSVW